MKFSAERIKNWLSGIVPVRGGLSEEEYVRAKEELLQVAPIPVIWLFGKTGSGKSSIIRHLTGVENIEIGLGYKPQTQFSTEYAFPDHSSPLLKFLDTRGIGEAHYDPTADIAAFETAAHLVVVTVRAMDHAVDELVTTVRTIRQSAPQRPILLALTALHDAYPGEQHPVVDPFDDSPFPLPEQLPDSLRRSIELHYQRFEKLVDRAVPLDFTPVAEGFAHPDFGSQRFKTALIELLPAAYRHNLLQMDAVIKPLRDLEKQRAMPLILGTSGLAATAAAVPVPWVDLPVVLGLQSHLVYKLARLHGQSVDAATIAQVSGALGGRVVLRMALREVLKVIPWVGMAANAAGAFAMTYALGMVWNWYFTQVKQGHVPDDSALQQMFQSQLQRAAELWRQTRESESSDEIVSQPPHTSESTT